MSQFGQAHLDSERRQAMRALLQQPLLSSGEELKLVKRHEQKLREWLTRNTGWRLVVRGEHARLYKNDTYTQDGTRGLPTFHPFRYCLLCLALAVLERCERQTTLASLADQVAILSAADPALEQFEELKNDLPSHEYRPECTSEDDVLVVTIPYQGQKLTLRDLSRDVQAEIDSARQNAREGGWLDHLRSGLDYRNWHEFSIERNHGDGWVRLTRRTHGTGSGGEKAIALTVPQFAAAAAYYSASPTAPRLILLDEAFAGVDSQMRGQCMGMLEAFDLDFVMTSEREWGTYAELKGLAIYQLSARPGVDAVHTSRWTWSGSQLRQTPVAATSTPAPIQNGLFDDNS